MASATLTRATFDMVNLVVQAEVTLEVQGRNTVILVDIPSQRVGEHAIENGRQEWRMQDVAELASIECGFEVGTVPVPY